MLMYFAIGGLLVVILAVALAKYSLRKPTKNKNSWQPSLDADVQVSNFGTGESGHSSAIINPKDAEAARNLEKKRY